MTIERYATKAIYWLGKVPIAEIRLDGATYLARVGDDWTRAEFHDHFDTMEAAVAWVDGMLDESEAD